MAGILLDEYSPRPWTMAYGMHRLRTVIHYQAGILLPLGGGLVYAIAGMAVTPPKSNVLVFAAVAGMPAAFGAHALWRWLSARLYAWMDAHPQSPQSIAAGYRLPVRPTFDEPAVILGECHVTRVYAPAGNYRLNFSVDDAYSVTPEWSVLTAKSLVTGLAILGAIGSGKTAFVLRPGLFQLFHHATRPGGLVMDSKAALVEPLKAEMQAAGREEDLLPIGPGQPTRWNPLHMPDSSAATIANSILTALENLNGSPYGPDSRWIRNGSMHVVEGVIGLLRLRTGYVTALAVRVTLAELTACTQGSDTPGQAVAAFIEALFSGSTAPTEHEAAYAHYLGLVQARMSEDEKFRQIYISELLSLLVPLTAPDVVERYNAPADQLDMPSWPEAINQGLVLVLDCNSRAVPGLAVILGMLLKLGYQDAMLSRLAWSRAGLCGMERYMALIIDEYQDYASPGDSDYLALCRESKSITAVLTQGYASVVQRVGEERAKVILQSLRNRLILTQTVPEFAADLLGQHEVSEVNRSIQESIQDASLHATGRFAGQSSVAESITVQRQRRHVIPPEALAALPTGQGILQSHDGDQSIPLHRVYLRPYYKLDTRHADLRG